VDFLASVWRHEKSRAVLLQVIVIAAVFGSFGWLISNLVTNFAALNKNFGFDFLFQPAGYDINQRLIEYTNRSTHIRAAVVGLLNTALVAIVGIVLATNFGSDTWYHPLVKQLACAERCLLVHRILAQCPHFASYSAMARHYN